MKSNKKVVIAFLCGYLGTVETGLGGDLHLQGQVQELRPRRVRLDPGTIKVHFNCAYCENDKSNFKNLRKHIVLEIP